MGMPNNLVLIRHGESEGNIAVARSKNGDHRDYSEEFRNRHSSLWRLSQRGVTQAKITGRWIQDNLDFHFDRFYTSEYLRAMETAAHLGIAGSEWYTEFFLRERNWGALDRISRKEQMEKFQGSMKEREIDPFYWTPVNGESLADASLRVDRVINTLHRECDGRNVAIVCHGDIIWTFQVRLERMSQERFRKLDDSNKQTDRIHNCQIIHYTRIDPFGSGREQAPYLNWVRSICPWDLERSSNKWKRVVRTRYTNTQLLARVNKVKRMVE